MQALTTKYMGPTDNRGARIKATCEAGSVTIGYPSELDQEEAHIAAAKALCYKLTNEGNERDGIDKLEYIPAKHCPWTQPFLSGSTKEGYAHVFMGSTPTRVL